MLIFQDVVDAFMFQDKSVVGHLDWRPSRDRSGLSAYWLIATRTEVTEHRLHLTAYPAKLYPAFTIMVDFKWQGREYPVVRLNVDFDEHTHLNHPPRPAGVEPLVIGNRLYPWTLNRAAFKPLTMVGLPYCVAFRSQISMPSAIRAVAGEARIDLTNVDLPERPARISLL